MAEKETKNQPKDLIEATPEEVTQLEKQESKEPEEEKILPPTEEKDVEKEVRKLDREERLKLEAEKAIAGWVPKTELGRQVKTGKIKDIDDVLENGKKILESEIVDILLPLTTDLILIGQAKGKFGGGKRRAWRQTQKKTKEGNVLSFSSMAVVGDQNGHVGVGYGKAKETLPAREKALRQAKLNIVKVKRGFENPESKSNDPHTVPFKVTGKCGSVSITFMPAPRGTGLVVGDEGKKILKLAGIKDVYSRSSGKTKTTFNFAKACVAALAKTTEMNE